MKYIEREATMLAENQIYTLPGIEYIDQLDEISLFSEGIKNRLAALNHTDILNDSKKIVSIILGCCKNAGVTISRQTLENWIKKAAPDGNKISRENVYKLCFALGMNEVETGEFFLKAYLERPYNYKNIHEAAYYFCLRNRKSYVDAERLIDKIENIPFSENSEAETVTERIGAEIRKFDNEEEFIKYICENRSGFAIQNKTATEKIKNLIEASIPLADKEYNLYKDPERKDVKVNSLNRLLAVIYDFPAREIYNHEKTFKSSIKNSDFPELIRRNFPEQQEFSNIHKGKASYDTIRKALIMLNFYHFFVSAKLEDADPNNLFDEFTEEMNSILMECGYVQLYWRNPYDWMIGYCAFTDTPIDMLRDLIQEYYLTRNE